MQLAHFEETHLLVKETVNGSGINVNYMQYDA